MKIPESVHIVDDDESVQMALSRVLQAAGYPVRKYRTAGDFLIVPPADQVGCVLLDVKMPGPSGLDLQDAMLKRGQRLPIIFISAFGDVPTTVRAIKTGAVDFLVKPVGRERLLAAVRAALAQDRKVRDFNDELTRHQNCFESLTKREKQVFDNVVIGRLNKQIAADLCTAERTVKAHRANLMEKMQVNSVAELVHIADLLSFNAPAMRP